jgi:hypothetical protein
VYVRKKEIDRKESEETKRRKKEEKGFHTLNREHGV